MAPRLPNVLIYLSALARPSRLRPDLRVKTIGHVDFAALRRHGFNAVVVDKDNCVTLPEQDGCFTPFKGAWAELLTAFDPGRVLVVSNSAGTRKDPLGIAANSVSHHLQTPVLVHARPKPGCADDIIKYFRGELSRPTTRAQKRLEQFQDAQKQYEGQLESILREHEEARIQDEIKRIRQQTSSPGAGSVSTSRSSITLPQPVDNDPEPVQKLFVEPPSDMPYGETVKRPEDTLRILVVGDRLFTDTLLAHRLRLLVPSSAASEEMSVLSIHTTSLPRPNDVPFLRWLEDLLSRRRLRDPNDPWARFVKQPSNPELDTLNGKTSLGTKWDNVKMDIRDSRMGWDPRKWTLRSVGIAIGKGSVWTIQGVWRGVVHAGHYIWTRSRRLYLDRRKAKELERQEQHRLESSAEAKILGIQTGKTVEERVAARDVPDTKKIEHKEVPLITSTSAQSPPRPAAPTPAS